MSDGASFGEVKETLQLDQCFVKIARLRNLSQKLSLQIQSENGSNTTARQKALGLLKLAIQVDTQLETFTDYLRANWPYLELPNEGLKSSPKDNDLIFANAIHIYPTYMSSHLWSSYRSARMICNSFISVWRRRAGLKIHPDPLPITMRARARLIDLVDTVCESVSFYLLDPLIILKLVGDGPELTANLSTGNEVCRASRLTFVLVAALMTDGLDDVRKHWIKDKIRRISDITTSGTLLTLAN